MNPIQEITLKWSLPVIPVYSLIHEHISRPLLINDSVVVLDGADLVQVDSSGTINWRCVHESGFWGNPVQVEDFIVCASIDNKVNFINSIGKVSDIIDLPTSVTTDILVEASGDIWFGMGGAISSVIRINSEREIVFVTDVSRDFGLRHPIARSNDGILWVATNDGLVRLNAQTGAILNTWDLVCASGTLVDSDGSALVVGVLSEHECALVQVTSDGNITAKYPLPPLWRAKIIRYRNQLWLVGSTVSPWESPTKDDYTLVASLAQNGEPLTLTKYKAFRAIDASVDLIGNLWVGTYTYQDEEDEESGELIVYDDNVLHALMMPVKNAGFGAPVFNQDCEGIVATTTALVSFSFSA